MGKVFLFFTSAELLRVPAESLIFITADGNYSTITMADGSKYILTMQLGQIEKKIAMTVENNDNRFIRIGKSLIVNRDFITSINPTRQKLILSDCRSFKHDISASREAIKALKDFIEKEENK